MKAFVKRYLAALVSLVAFGVFIASFARWREAAVANLWFQARTMLLVVPPIFILLGLIDVWVPRERMIKLMGSGSGARGAALAFGLGSFAAGPLYGAFPFAAVLMKKGASFNNILIFIGAWSTTKLPMLLFEASALGARFALSRLAIDVAGIALIAWAMNLALPAAEREKIYANAAAMD